MFPPFPTFYQLRRPNCELYYLDHIFHWVIMVADFQFATLQSKSFFLSLPSLDMCPMIKIRSTHWNHSLSYSSLTGHLRKLNSHSNKLVFLLLMCFGFASLTESKSTDLTVEGKGKVWVVFFSLYSAIQTRLLTYSLKNCTVLIL